MLYLTTILDKEYHHYFYYITPITRILDFCLGILLYKLLHKFENRNININYSFIEFISIFLFIVFFIFHQYVPLVYRYSFFYWIPMCCILGAFSFQKGIISNFLSKKTFIILGEISFGFYMFHLLIIRYITFIFKRVDFLDSLHEIIKLLICLIISILVSYFSYYYVEIPLNNKIKNKFNDV